MPGCSRYSLYREIDQPALKPLPEIPYERFLWKTCKAGKNYHIPIAQAEYSVPYTLVGQKMECRYNGKIVEFFCRGRSVAIHMRTTKVGEVVTQANHRPKKHLYQAEITPEILQSKGEVLGDSVGKWVAEVLRDESRYIKQRINTALGVIRLTKHYPAQRIDAACQRGLFYKNFKLAGGTHLLFCEFLQSRAFDFCIE